VIISNSAHILAGVTGDEHHLSPSNMSRRETRISVRTAGRAHRAWHQGSQLCTVSNKRSAHALNDLLLACDSRTISNYFGKNMRELLEEQWFTQGSFGYDGP
jgi:hypothetical protein